MATASLIQFYRGNGFSHYEFPTLPSATGPLYNGSTIIKSIASGSPWANTSTNQFFVGSVCVNPELRPKSPISLHADRYDFSTGEVYHILDFIYNNNHFSVINNALNLNLNPNDFTTGPNGVSIIWPSSSYTLPSANTTILGGIKPSWSGVVTDLEDVFDHKSTTAPALASTENKYYPIISEAASTLNITSDYPYNVFETATATDGRLFTVLRPATRTFAGTIKVSAPLAKAGTSNPAEMFPGSSSTYRWLDDTTTGVASINTKITYLARLTNRIDLLNNNGVDLDLKLTGTAYPSASNQTLAQRDSLFETFVPLPLPSTSNPGIAKISWGSGPWAGSMESPANPHAYPIALDSNDMLVAIAPNALVVNTTTPNNGDLIMYSPNDDWGPAKPSRLKIQVNGTQVANFGVEDSTDSTVNLSIPDAVSGTNDGTNWTSITIGNTTKAIPYQDISGKADKVSNATNGNFAALDSNGNLTDSGHKHSDYLTSQVNADWNAVSGAAQIFNKPILATVATSGSYNDLSNKPTIPDTVSGTNDGTNWTSLTIGSVTKNIPSGGGGGGTVSHDYTHSSVSVVSTSTTTVTFAANQKCTKYISVSNDVDIAFAINNFASNYLWVINTSNNDIDVTFSLASNSTLGTILNYHMPEDPLTIPAGKEAEIGIIVNADGAFITYRSDLVKTSFLQATVNVSSSNNSYGTATLTGGPTYTFASGSSQSVTMTASPASGCIFTKWQSSSNGTTWTDVSGGTNQTLTVSLNASGTYYYKAIFSSGISVSAVPARVLTPNGSTEAKAFLGNNYEDNITVSPGTTIYLSTDGYPIDYSSTSYLDYSNASNFVVGYEYSTNNGSTWNFVSINDSSFSAGSTETIVRPIAASEVYIMELTATTMAVDPSMTTMSNDYVSIEISIEGNFVSSPTLDYYNMYLYIPVFDGESMTFSGSFMSVTQPGNFSVGDSMGNSIYMDSYGSTYEQIYFGDSSEYSLGTQWTTDSCSGTLTVGYDESPDPNDPNNPGGGY